MRLPSGIRENNQRPLLEALADPNPQPSLFAKNDHKPKLSIKCPVVGRGHALPPCATLMVLDTLQHTPGAQRAEAHRGGSVDVVVSGKNVEVPSHLRQYMEQKLQRIAHHLPAAVEVHVQVAQEATRSQTDRMVVQATLNCNGTLLRGEERGANAQEAFDLVLDVLDRQAQRYKSRLYRSEVAKRKGNRESIRGVEGATEEEEELEGEEALAGVTLARRKRFALSPMTLEDARAQMDLLGHTFFLFLNDDTGEVNLLYTRRDGTYGLIEAR